LRSRAIAFGIILLPMGLIVIQGDPGSATIFLAFSILLYREGLHSSFFIAGISIFLAFVLTIIYDPLIVIPLFIAVVGILYLLQLKNKRIGVALFLILLVLNFLFWNYPMEETAMFDGVPRSTLLLGIMVVDSLAIVFASLYLWTNRARQLVTIMMPALILLSSISVGTNYFFNNVLKPHQQDRINVWLKPSECDPRKSLYNIIQSKTAIGSGGLTGKGYLNGTMTELDHVPEQTTDFIFSIVGEEQGFLGVFSIILLFGVLIYPQ